MSAKIDFSPGESAILGLKVGRCNSDFIDETALYQQIIESDYDLCRLKVPAEDEMVSYRLNKMGLPFFFSGSIRRYKTRISVPPAENYNFPDIVFEIYNGSQNQLLKDMLIGTWGTYPIGYYRTPYIQTIVSKEKEIECVFEYYKKFNLNKNYPGNSIVFMKHRELYVGFFALNIVDNNLESHIGGILKPYRKEGYFLDMLRYIKEFCFKHDLKHFIFGARNENAEVQKIFQFVGFIAIGSENVFHIPSLLTYSKLPVVTKEIGLISDNSQNLYQQLLNEVTLIGGKHSAGFNRTSFQLNQANLLPDVNSVKVRFSFPVITNQEVLIVLKNEITDTPFITGYFKANPG